MDRGSLNKLKHEARDLGRLLGRFLKDWAFISEPEQPDRKLLFFIDAHEIKCYIEPHRPDGVNGFILEAERFCAVDRPKEEGEIALLSQALLSSLLFDTNRDVGVLPSHGEEIDEEIAFQRSRRLQQMAKQVPVAKQQAERLREKARLRLAVWNREWQQGELDQKAFKEKVLEFVRAGAPTLMALLSVEPESPIGRINRLMENSNIAPLSHIDWEGLGCDAGSAERLRGLRPDPDLVNRWRRSLDAKRRNSRRANQIDAEALASIEQVNEILHEQTGDRVQARFVTRAMTLIRAARDEDMLNQFDLKPVDFLCHPRLMALHARRTETSEAYGEPAEQMRVALRTHRKHLTNQEVVKEDAVASVHGTPPAFVAAIAQMVQTWKKFESWRIAMAPPHQSVSAQERKRDDDEVLQTLIEGFLHERSALRLIDRELQQQVDRFGRETFALSSAVIPEDVPVLAWSAAAGRIRILPLTACSIGPLQFAHLGLEVGQGLHLEPKGRERLEDSQVNAAERYLGWALLLACGQRWSLAETYADSAESVARILQLRNADAIADEASLLRAQVRRLAPPSPEKGRAERPLPELRPQTNDARFALERAAQALERALAAHAAAEPAGAADQSSGPVAASVFPLLNEAFDQTGRDAILRLQALTLALCCELAPGGDPQGKRASEWFRDLRGHLGRLRQSVGTAEHLRGRSGVGLPFLPRAVEIVAYQACVPDDPEGMRAGRRESAAGASPRLAVPSEVRLEAQSVLDALEKATDATSRLVQEMLTPIVQRIRRQRRRELVYAPILASYAQTPILQLMPAGEVQELARGAFERIDRIAGISQEVGVGPENREDLGRARDDLDRAYELLQTKTATTRAVAADAAQKPPDAAFYLRMEACYARLLLVLVSPRDDQHAEREALADRYRQIAAEYPQASIPHLRLDVVLTDLARQSARSDRDHSDALHAEAAEALEAARRRLVDDTSLQGSDHWVRSTIERRHAQRIFTAAEKACDAWLQARREGLPHADAERGRIAAMMTEAFRIVRDGFDITAHRPDHLHRLEATRRANNILYYAMTMKTKLDMPDALDTLGITLAEIDQLCDYLSPGGLQVLDDWDIAHTLGCSYAALGRPLEATKAGDRLADLIFESGEDLSDPKLGKMLVDAQTWVWAATQSLPRPGAVHENQEPLGELAAAGAPA